MEFPSLLFRLPRHFAFTNIPAAIPPVTNWQETHSFWTMWRLPPTRPLAVRRGCHLFPIHHNIMHTLCLHLPLTEFISHLGFLNAWKACSWRLSKLSGSLLSKALQRATCQGFCWRVSRATIRSQIPYASYSVYCLPISQPAYSTQPPSLFTNFSQESLWKLSVGTDSAAKRDVLRRAKLNHIHSQRYITKQNV